jgi:hypothetical protein
MELLKDRHSKELQELKDNLVDLYEKKNDYLREKKDENERRIARCEQELKDKT